jgi:hypothetical protein
MVLINEIVVVARRTSMLEERGAVILSAMARTTVEGLLFARHPDFEGNIIQSVHYVNGATVCLYDRGPPAG